MVHASLPRMLTVHAAQVFMRPPRIMLRSLVDLSLDSAQGSSLLGTSVTALHACMTFAMLTITYGAGASLGVVTPVLQVTQAPGAMSIGRGCDTPVHDLCTSTITDRAGASLPWVLSRLCYR